MRAWGKGSRLREVLRVACIARQGKGESHGSALKSRDDTDIVLDIAQQRHSDKGFIRCVEIALKAQLVQGRGDGGRIHSPLVRGLHRIHRTRDADPRGFRHVFVRNAERIIKLASRPCEVHRASSAQEDVALRKEKLQGKIFALLALTNLLQRGLWFGTIASGSHFTRRADTVTFTLLDASTTRHGAVGPLARDPLVADAFLHIARHFRRRHGSIVPDAQIPQACLSGSGSVHTASPLFPLDSASTRLWDMRLS